MKSISITKAAMLSAAALSLAPTAASAQTDNGTTIDTEDTREERDDKDFPWGLLGLLGLAGLLRKRRDPDIHVDARRDTRP